MERPSVVRRAWPPRARATPPSVERRQAGLDVIHPVNLWLVAGACQHPDGVVRFITGALRVFEADFRDHGRHGRCERCSRPALLPAPTGERAWVST
jgi:hypothetical protein